jgi:6-phosphogluconolactonase
MDGCGNPPLSHSKRSSTPHSISLHKDVRVTDPISRRSFVKIAAISSFAAQAWWAEAKTAATQDSHLLFAGTQTGASSKGIYAFHWDPSNGELKELGLAVESDNPTFIALSPDGEHLFAANETNHYEGTQSGSVSSFSIDRTAAKLTAINSVSAMGAGTCHVSLDHTGRTLLCANYSGGSSASFRVDASGHLSEAVSHFQYEGHGVNPDRQEKPHAHRTTVSPDNRYAYINDLGLDCIHIYHLDAATAKLTAADPAQWSAKPGSGPRALRFHPSGKWAFCVHEMLPAVEVLAWDSNTGALTSVQRVDLVPKDYRGSTATGSEIVFDPAGHFAYVAVRGYDHIITLRIDGAGKLTQIGSTSCGGKVPRHIAVDPTGHWLLVANQVSDNIAVIRRDPQTGKLDETGGSSFPLVKPQCLVFV